MTSFICVQMGARRNYAVPAILADAGQLERFYTDICGNVGFGRVAAAMAAAPFSAALCRLAGRQVPMSVRCRTHTFAGPVLRHALRSARTADDPTAVFHEHLRFGRDIGTAMIAAGYGTATHIYSMLGEGGPFILEGRRRGLRVVSEVYIALSTERMMQEERCAYPDWEPDAPDYDAVRRESPAANAMLAASHRFVCPSEIVQDDLMAHWGVGKERTAVVPYGVKNRWPGREPQPVRGRILFVGSAGLRKGIHYLAMAADKLARRGCRYQFRIAGDATEQVRRQPLCRQLTFLGRVPRDRIQAEYRAADVFVLPSLAEGSAESTYEALAAGLPVITTRAAGSVVRDRIEGRIVPERDADALADAIEEIVEDRPLRDRMAAAARAHASDYTWERYAERLLAALRSMN